MIYSQDRQDRSLEETSPYLTPEASLTLVADETTRRSGLPLECVQRSAWHSSYEVRHDSAGGGSVDRATLRIIVPAMRSWYLSPRRTLIPVVGAVCPPWPTGDFAVVQWGRAFFQVRFGAGSRLRLLQSPGRLTASITLRDREACGLRLWGADKFVESPREQTLKLTVSRLTSLDEAIWAEPFPGGAPSCICLTDHPDWDSVRKATILYELFGANDIRITKAVFPHADPGWDYGPGMDSHDYAAIIDEWHRAGHEIAYHGLGSAREAPVSLDECTRRIERLSPYRPETWIDHGSGEYRIVKRARLAEDVDLLPYLAARGVKNYWSYADVWHNPASYLHLWHPRRGIGAFSDFARLTRVRGWTSPRQLAYLASIPVKNLTGSSQYRQVLSQPWAFSEWRALLRNGHLLRHLRREPLFLYHMNGDSWCGERNTPLVFDTILLNHVAFQLSPSNIERLVQESGLLLAHTYLGDVNPKGGGNCFHIKRDSEILGRFRENIEHMGHIQSRGDLVTSSLRDLRNAVTDWAEVGFVRRSDGWEVHGTATVSSRTKYRVIGEPSSIDHQGVFRTTVSDNSFLSLG